MITPGVYICTGGGEFVCRIHMFYLRSAGGINLDCAPLLTEDQRPVPRPAEEQAGARALAARRGAARLMIAQRARACDCAGDAIWHRLGACARGSVKWRRAADRE